jgi:hypothetical protein
VSLTPAQIHGGTGARIRRRQIKIVALQLLEPVVLGRFQLMRLHALLDQRDVGLKQRPVETAAIELARRGIGGGDDDDVAREEMLEQPAQDHGIGDVGNLQLVEAKQRRA